MQVLYEGSVFEIMRCGGVARYFTELINRLPNDIYPLILGPDEPPSGMEHANFHYQGIRTEAPIKFFRKVWRPIQQARIGKLIDAQPADLIHWTYYSGLCKRPIQKSKVPTVITLYDFIHEAFPESDPGGKHHRTKVDAIKIADQICCISQATYDDLCERHPDAADRACVTPLGIGFEKIAPDPLPTELRNRPYFLFVGRRDSYKNFTTLWVAWNQIKSTIPETQLVIVGPPLKKRERAEFQWESHSERVQLYENASDALLKTLYQNCSAFVFPSKMEGFGLPILEALANDAPVIATDCAAFHEVAASAAYFFDGANAAELAGLLVAASKSELADREHKAACGKQQVDLFSWENTAAKTVQVYESLIGSLERNAA